MTKISIGVISPHTIPSVFLQPLQGIIDYTREKIGETELIVSTHPFLHGARNSCAQKAIDNGSDYLFFLDADVIAPKNIIELLLKQDKEIISGPYHYKKPPYPPLGYTKVENKTDYVLNTRIRKKELYQVDAIGAGCMLLKTSALKKIGQPLFDVKIGETWVGEDIHFCHKAQQQGFDIWYDNTITGIKHFGASVDYSDYMAWLAQIEKGNVKFNVKK